MHVNVLEDIVKNWKEEIVMEYYVEVKRTQLQK